MEKTDNSYIAIDLETTGLNPKTERIIEIGAARVEDGTVVQTYSTFVNPERELDARIRELTGICDDDLKDAPVLDTVLPELLAFCGELPLLGHHVIFDFSFLKRAAVNRKYTFEHAGLDTLKICRHFMPEEERRIWQPRAGILRWIRARAIGRFRMRWRRTICIRSLKTGIFWKCRRCLHRSL